MGYLAVGPEPLGMVGGVRGQSESGQSPKQGPRVHAEPLPQGPEGPSPLGFLLPGGSPGHSNCPRSGSSPPPPGSAGTSGAQTAATGPPPVGRGWGQLQAWPGVLCTYPDPLWPCLLEGHPVGLQLQDTTEQGVMGTQGDEARLRQPQAIADGDRASGGPSRELQADTTGQGHRAAVRGHREAECGQGRRQIRHRGTCVSAPGTPGDCRRPPSMGKVSGMDRCPLAPPASPLSHPTPVEI